MHGENSLSLAGAVNKTDPDLFVSSRAHRGIRCRAKRLEELREVPQDIVRDDKHAGQIIQHLRSLLMRGELPIQRIDIADVVRDVLTVARGRLTERNVQVTLRIDEGVSGVLANRVELQQVLLNLVLNASEAMSANAPGDRQIQVEIALDAEQSAFLTSIIDCGKGIDRDQLDHIFDPFFTTKQGGLGLGLAVCRSIILAHKGRRWAANNSDRGAAFNFTLPVTRGEGQQ